MRRCRVFLFCVLLLFSMLPLRASSIGAYCVMAQDGRILYARSLHEVQSVASISKVMTAVVALEHGELDQRIVIGEEIRQVDGSCIYLREGEEYVLEDLLYGLLLRSGNDAAVSIAKGVAGDPQRFVAWMNEKAQELGMQDTLFRNPSGLDETDGGNLSSVYDMALLMNYAMQNETFAKISATRQYENEKGTLWTNKNRLLTQYGYATGGKTGYTREAGRTLVSSARKEQLFVVIVTFGMSDDFDFHETYYEKAFSEYEGIPLIEPGTYQLMEQTFVVASPPILTVRRQADHQVKETCSEQGYRIEASSEGHTMAYTYPWR